MISKNLSKNLYNLSRSIPKPNKYLLTLFNQSKHSISTEIIKAHHKQISKANPSLLRQYPKTFEGKVIVLNEPKMIQAIQIIEFGAKYKPGKKYLFIFLLAISTFTYFHQQMLP
jgi:hypothetical protein